jgi:hypothetical protein
MLQLMWFSAPDPDTEDLSVDINAAVCNVMCMMVELADFVSVCVECSN